MGLAILSFVFFLCALTSVKDYQTAREKDGKSALDSMGFGLWLGAFVMAAGRLVYELLP